MIFNSLYVYKMLRLIKNSSIKKTFFSATIQNNVMHFGISEHFMCTEISIENSSYVEVHMCYCHISF